MTTTYRSSKGEDLVITDMAYPYLKSAHAKLIREQIDGERQAEIDAMTTEITNRGIERAKAEAEAAQTGEAA